MTKVIQAAAVAMTGLLAGNELGTLIGSHPALRSLPRQAEIEAERALTRQLGAIMPFYMTATLASTVAAALDRRGATGFGRAVAGAGATAGMLAITLVGNVSLNKRTISYPSDGERREWEQIRRRWELLHGTRVLLDLAAFGCLTSALADG